MIDEPYVERIELSDDEYIKIIMTRKERKMSEKTIIGVQYKNKATEGFGGRTYTYFCEIPVEVGDLVEAPTASGISPAMVAEIDVPEIRVAESVLPLLKTITSFLPAKSEPEQSKATDTDVDNTSTQISEPMQTAELIIVKRLPIIEEHLRSVSEEIEKEVNEAKALVCTDETVKSVKSVRSNLTKKYAALEKQRIAVKNAVLAPYNTFEAVYKECVTDKFTKADTDLKDKIDAVEDGLKNEKEAEIKKYYAELCSAYGIDFVPWEKSGVKITLSSTPKSLKDQISRGLSRIMDDMEVIAKQSYVDEILAEYKQSLNLNQAITHVTDIHKSIEEAAIRKAETAEIRSRTQSTVTRINSLAPPKEVAPPPREPSSTDQTFKLTFKVIATREKLQALKKFLIDGGYQYE